MKITQLKVNHIHNPLGYDISRPVFTFIIEQSSGNYLKAFKICISDLPDMSNILYDSGMSENLSPLGFTVDYPFEGGVRYYWNITAQADDGDIGVSDISWFEGGRKQKEWNIKWIGSPLETHPIFYNHFQIDKSEIEFARLYICGLGLYEAYINNKKVGDEYLAPFFNDYRFWTQYETYDITQNLCSGKNTIAVMLGNGWYKGRFGYLGDGTEAKIYGDDFRLTAELVIVYKNKIEQRICTDEHWKCIESPIKESSIYDGEIYDATQVLDTKNSKSVILLNSKNKLVERMSVPVKIHERFSPQKLIITPKGEQVIDFGQEITGWVEFSCEQKKGTKIILQYGEILQDDCFYRDNLRTAKAEFVYISNGKKENVRPHFTYYGFRYVKVAGIKLTNENFRDYQLEACAIYSDLERTGFIETSNPKLNRLLQNTLWGQKGNFLDIPTDCPQRDERLGWTGDAQVFCATASYHMNTAPFYRKYLKDMLYEQKLNNGAVPYVVPDVLSIVRKKLKQPSSKLNENNWGEAGSCAWGDAATVIPWTMYVFYGDKLLLNECYDNMKQWTDFIIYMDKTYCNNSRLWTVGFHFADWLALDNPDKESCFGKTDPYFIASAYYLYSCRLTAKAAKVLGKTEDEHYYTKIEQEVKNAIRKKYITESGKIIIDTQTALVLCIHFDIIPKEFYQQTANELRKKLEQCNMHLDTGFVGTAYLCMALTKVGLVKEAYTLLLQEDYPSWLYEVNMGATTVWERWNSVLPNGKISGTGMNSLNHYAYGAVAEWVYRTVCGIAPDENGAGFSKAIIAPIPDKRINSITAKYYSASGLYKSSWEYTDNKIKFEITIPFGCEARFIIPDKLKILSINGEPTNEITEIILNKGTYILTANEIKKSHL